MASRKDVRTVSPEYGTIRTGILVAAAAVMVVSLGSTLAASVDRPGVETALYGLVGVIAVAAAIYEGGRQRDRNPHQFAARDVLERFYDNERPTPQEHVLHLAATVSGGVAVWYGAPPAYARLDGALLVGERLATGGPLPAIDPVNAAWGGVVIAGIILLAVGVDRLIVGVYRDLRYYHARRSD